MSLWASNAYSVLKVDPSFSPAYSQAVGDAVQESRHEAITRARGVYNARRFHRPSTRLYQ